MENRNDFKLFIQSQLAGLGKSLADLGRAGFNSPQRLNHVLKQGYEKMGLGHVRKIAEYLGYTSEIEMLEAFHEWQQVQQDRLQKKEVQDG